MPLSLTLAGLLSRCTQADTQPVDDRPGVGDAITQRVAEFLWDAKPALRRPAQTQGPGGR